MTRRLAVVATMLACMVATPAAARHQFDQSGFNTVTEFCGERYGRCPGASVAKAPAHRRAKARASVKSAAVKTASSATQNSTAAQPQTSFAFGGFTSNSLVSEARKYIGTNPTGRGSLWCGAFMDMVLKRTGHAGGGNLASAYARYGTRAAGPQVGAIAVMGRRGGGHVGVVTGVDRNGNPIIISGNTWSRASGGRPAVLEHAYPRSRIYAYVVPP